MSTCEMRGFTTRQGDTEGPCIQAGLKVQLPGFQILPDPSVLSIWFWLPRSRPNQIAHGQVSKCGSPTRCKQCLQTWTVCSSFTRAGYVISTPLQLGRQHNPG